MDCGLPYVFLPLKRTAVVRNGYESTDCYFHRTHFQASDAQRAADTKLVGEAQ